MASVVLALLVSSIAVHVANAKWRHHHPRAHNSGAVSGQVIGGRPAGCPHAYCGCGLARYLGLHDRRLWLAANWVKLFPRTQMRAGAVAVRRHHVMQLVEHVGGTRYLVRDYNGRHHLSWLHVRDVRGFVFVDPGARSASLF